MAKMLMAIFKAREEEQSECKRETVREIAKFLDKDFSSVVMHKN